MLYNATTTWGSCEDRNLGERVWIYPCNNKLQRYSVYVTVRWICHFPETKRDVLFLQKHAKYKKYFAIQIKQRGLHTYKLLHKTNVKFKMSHLYMYLFHLYTKGKQGWQEKNNDMNQFLYNFGLSRQNTKQQVKVYWKHHKTCIT